MASASPEGSMAVTMTTPVGNVPITRRNSNGSILVMVSTPCAHCVENFYCIVFHHGVYVVVGDTTCFQIWNNGIHYLFGVPLRKARRAGSIREIHTVGRDRK